jgi:cytoskeleton protein RodZ
MSDVVSEVPATPARSAGKLLREARQAQGMHIAALAATIKVSQRKLESLEADRLEELPDATFTRALAQTVCRALKMDPTPVLALLPAPVSHRLEHASQGINEPFRERTARVDSSERISRSSPGMWAALVLIVLAGVVYLLPQSWLASLNVASSGVRAPESASSGVSTVVLPAPVEPVASGVPQAQVSAASAATVPGADVGVPTALPAGAASSAVIDAAAADAAQVSTTSGEPAPAPAAASAPASVESIPSASTSTLRLHALAPSWVEVRDAGSKIVFARLVKAGEDVTLDAPAPLRVKIGNARGTRLTFRGQEVDLVAAGGRDNVARLDLK